jgi:coenzyme F420-0:L-glutamate ligase/coenzyme F420-1:gamma-L-glutamate ligase
MTETLGTDRPQRAVELIPLPTDRVVDLDSTAGRSAAEYFCDLLALNGVRPQTGDVLAVTSKIVSFHEGAAVRLSDVMPSRKARVLGRLFRKDPREVQVLMEVGRVAIVIPMTWLVRYQPLWRALEAMSPNSEAMRRAFAQNHAFTFMVNAHAAYLDDAGIDHSNVPGGVVVVLPKDPCAVASRIRAGVQQRFGAEVAVVITDTLAKLGRVGSNDVAVGYAGMDPVSRLTFGDDLFGVPRSGGVDVIIDSIAAMAGFVMGQRTEMTPAVLVRGVTYKPAPAGEEGAGMRALEYPPGTLWRGVVLTLVASVGFRVANLLTFQRWPRRTRA